ncbi:MAG TPA: flagellar basal body P-ring protein FlgI [Bryobacteraceae bacterium]|nr:flagellar basal body P-ring protein FlgI [Bryobacteraceae bacterium]
MRNCILSVVFAASIFPLASRGATPVRNLVSIEGVRDNQLLGYGLVVGLNGTGDKQQTIFSVQSLTNLLSRMGVSVPSANILVHDVAAVLVTADLPAFARSGDRIDVTVAAIGDATNLQGGLLVMTPLKAANAQIYAVAQGSVITGGFVAGRGGNSRTVNHPTAGRIPGGAIVERGAPSVEPDGRIHLQLLRPDFTTAARIAHALNQRFKDWGTVAHTDNAGLVSVDTPAAWKARTVEFIAAIQDVPVEPDRPARIVVNERTGTVVFGGDVHIAPVSILHGALSVNIETSYNVSQPAPLSQGKTTVTPQTKVTANAGAARSVSLESGASVEELVRALLSIGTTPRDIIAILQSAKAAGALDAELEVI